MTVENLDGTTSEQLMLRDFIYELHDILNAAETENEKLPGYRLGIARVAGLLEDQLREFGIDQSGFARQMPDVEAWLLNGMSK